MFQRVIRREDARRNPRALYVFGDNVVRKGLGGLAKQLRYEPNAVGVRTKYTPGPEYFVEAPAEIAAQNRMIDEDFKRLFDHVKDGGVVVWPTAGIGTGLARLPSNAPTTFEYLRRKLSALIACAGAG